MMAYVSLQTVDPGKISESVENPKPYFIMIHNVSSEYAMCYHGTKERKKEQWKRYLQPDLGYPATSGQAPIRIKVIWPDMGVMPKHNKFNTSRAYTCFDVSFIVSTVFVTNYCLHEMDIDWNKRF